MAVIAESFIFGLTNSLHCAGMCGPLAACTGAARGSAAAAYHVARAAAYGAVGAVAGGLGRGLGSGGLAAPAAWVSFVLAGALLWFALGGQRHLVAVPAWLGPVRGVLRRSAAWSPATRAAALGAVTPLLPCGLSWTVYGSAFLAGSWQEGATVVAGFAVGSLPALLLFQAQLAWLRRELSPEALARVVRGAMLVAAAVLAWRGWAALHETTCCAST